MTDKKDIPWFKSEGVLGKTYTSQKALAADVQAIINPMRVGERVAASAMGFLLDLLKHHPEWDEKVGGGVYYLEKRHNTDGGQSTYGLWIVRTDGTAIDISWWAAIRAAHTPYHRMVRDAARYAINGQVQIVARGSAGGCAVCGSALVGATHVDHAPPLTFETLFGMWSQNRGVIALADVGTRSVFAHDTDLHSWQEFHELFADLRVLHARCNLSQVKGV